MLSERLWIDPVTGDWGFREEGPKTLYVDPNATQMREWIDKGKCVFCGAYNDGDKCRCRFCDSCSQTWIATTLADFADTDHGPRPRKENCPECINAAIHDKAKVVETKKEAA